MQKSSSIVQEVFTKINKKLRSRSNEKLSTGPVDNFVQNTIELDGP